MYIPPTNLMDNQEEILEFIQKYSFATVVTSQNGIPVATHLPIISERRGDKLILISHFAKANPQWRDIENGKLLVIFSEPHAYISPSNYEKIQEVPTWNYLSIHAYGIGSIISDPKEVFSILEKTINSYEAKYLNQWNTLSDQYKISMANGIVCFEMEVTELQGKKKLSQNKTLKEKQNIIESLSKSDDGPVRTLADYMQRNV